MSGLALLFWIVLRVVDLILDELTRKEAETEVRQEQEQINDAATKAAEQIDADALTGELDALRERMRHYQRTTP